MGASSTVRRALTPRTPIRASARALYAAAASLTLTLAACGESGPTEPPRPYGVIHGHVTVPEARGVASVIVKLEHADGTTSTTTDENGAYIFERLSMGAYTVVLDSLPDDVRFVQREESAELSPPWRDTLRVNFKGHHANVWFPEETVRPDAYYGLTYADTLVARGGGGEYEWEVFAGELPPGLALDPRGVITGVPDAWGTWSFSVRVTSWTGESASTSFDTRVTLSPTARCADHPDHAIPGFASGVLEGAVKASLGLGSRDQLDCATVRTAEDVTGRFEGVHDLAGAQNLTGMTRLNLTIPGVTDLSPLEDLTGLRTLILGHGAISDMTPLESLVNLETLNLEQNAVSDLSPLGGLSRLKELGLNDNEVTDLTPIAGLDGLTRLSLSFNNVSDLEPISGFPALARLDLNENPIVNAEVLTSLPALWYLSLRNMPHPVDLTLMPNLPALAILDLRSNGLSDIGPLGDIVELQILGLEENPDVTDLQPLIDSPWMGEGDNLFLKGTGASCADVAALATKGVDVNSSCEPS